jgi:hypothetical protein
MRSSNKCARQSWCDAERKIPVMSYERTFADEGGLVSYGGGGATPTVHRSMRDSVGLGGERPAILMSTATMSATGVHAINDNAGCVSVGTIYCIAAKCVAIKDHIPLAIWGLTLAQLTSIHQASG